MKLRRGRRLFTRKPFGKQRRDGDRSRDHVLVGAPEPELAEPRVDLVCRHPPAQHAEVNECLLSVLKWRIGEKALGLPHQRDRLVAGVEARLHGAIEFELRNPLECRRQPVLGKDVEQLVAQACRSEVADQASLNVMDAISAMPTAALNNPASGSGVVPVIPSTNLTTVPLANTDSIVVASENFGTEEDPNYQLVVVDGFEASSNLVQIQRTSILMRVQAFK